MKNFYLAIFFLLVSSLPAHAYLLKGKVSDADGEAIPYANVYVENSTYGVVTNVKGEYFLELERGEYRIVFQSLGYEKQVMEVSLTGNQEMDVVLQPEAVEMEAVEVTAGRKDPAYAIMQKVIAEKRRYIKQFESYKCETYLKVSLERDTLLRKPKRVSNKEIARRAREEAEKDSLARVAERDTVATVPDSTEAVAMADSTVEERDTTGALKKRQKLNFIESWSTTNFRYPGQYKSEIHAYRDMTEKVGGGVYMEFNGEGMEVKTYQPIPNNPYLFYTDVSDADINFYKNLVEAYDLGDRPFVSPLSATSWKLTYKYKLEEQFMEDGRVIYKIWVTPRLKAGPYFEGHIYIVDEIWAIKSVNLTILPSTLSFFNHFQVLHQYEQTEDERWILSREDYYYTIKDGRDRYYGSTIALHDEHELDVEFPNRFFKNEVRKVADDARDKDSTFWSTHRPITLKTAELDFIHFRDSINTYHKSEEYLHRKDSIYNKIKWFDPLFNGLAFRQRDKGMSYFIQPLITQVRPFGVGGYRHALGGYVAKEWDSFNRLIVDGELDYGFKNKDPRGRVKVSYTYLPKKLGSAYIRYGNSYTMVNSFATIAQIFARGNYINSIYYGLGHEIEVFNGVKLNVGLLFADRKAIDQLELAQWSQELFGDDNQPQGFDLFREAKIDLQLEITPGQKYISEARRKIILGSKWPTFKLRYRKAIPGIWDSRINYDYVEVSATDEFRPGTLGISRWAARAGTYIQDQNLRFTDYTFFRGSDRYLFVNPLKAFQSLGPTISTPNAFFSANYLHDFGGALIDKIPLLNRTPLQVTGGAGVLLIEDGSFFHSEVYGGLQFPFRIKGQRFKLGAYYVTSFSTQEKAIAGQWKFGITFFNSFKNRWEY